MYRIIISPRAKKQLKPIRKIYQQAINEALEEITYYPLAGKPLTRELTGKYSYKIGTYRIIYKVSKRDQKIYVLSAGHRATIYK